MFISRMIMSLKGLRLRNVLLNGNNGGRDPGPPDLEEVWRDVNRKLAGLFGRKGGDGDSGGGLPGPRQLGGGISLVVFVVLALWLASGTYTVDASERGVVLRFGKKVRVVGPGLQWRMPYPIETHELVNLSGVRTVEIGSRGTDRGKTGTDALMLTDDENIVNIQFAVQFIVKDPEQFLFNNRFQDKDSRDRDGSGTQPVESAVVAQVAESALREIVGKSKMDAVLNEGRGQIEVNAQVLMQTILDRYNTGILISKVTMQNAQPPEPVQDAFNDAVKAGQDFERLKNEGQAYANDVLGKMEGPIARLKQESVGYAGRVVAMAQGDAARFKSIVVEYAKAPEVTRQRMYLDTMQQIFANTAKVMVDAKGNGNLLYLPLDKLMQVAGAATPPPAQDVAAPARAATPAPAEPVAAPKVDAPGQVDYRSRDAMRTRDRGDR